MRVLTYNIEMGGRERFEQLYTVLAHAEADIISLTEADDREVVAELARALEMDHIWARGSGARHIATLSRTSIVEWQIVNKKPLTQAALVTVHDTRPFGNERFILYNVHLRPDPFWHYELMRTLATLALLRLTRLRQGPHLIVGDLNTYAPGDPIDIETLLRYTSAADRRKHALQRYRFLRLAVRLLHHAGYTDCYRHLHPDTSGYTFTRHRIPINRMDYIFAEPQMAGALRACALGHALPQAASASDHFPLWADFATREEI